MPDERSRDYDVDPHPVVRWAIIVISTIVAFGLGGTLLYQLVRSFGWLNTVFVLVGLAAATTLLVLVGQAIYGVIAAGEERANGK